MDIEKKVVKLFDSENCILYGNLILYEEAPDDIDLVAVELTFGNCKISLVRENFFSALIAVRRILEKQNIQIICNGASKTVYPSPMQLSMGTGRVAYKLYTGQKASMADVVDIFDCDENMEFVSIEEQEKFYSDWLKGF